MGGPKTRNDGTVERWNGGTVERRNGGTAERRNGGELLQTLKDGTAENCPKS